MAKVRYFIKNWTFEIAYCYECFIYSWLTLFYNL